MDNIELSKASLDDIVFENRNKSYGAYLLRRIYDKNVMIALGISIALFSLALATPVIIKFFSKEEIVIVPEEIPDEVTIIDVPLDPAAPPPPPIEQPPPPEIKTVKFIPPEPAPDPEVTEPPPPPQEKLNTQNISNENREGKDTLADIPNIPIGPVGGLGEEESVWMGAVTKETGFPGGMESFKKYVNSHMSQKAITYAQDRGIKGRAWVTFEVKKDGSISNVSIIKGKEIPNCNICNEAVVEVIKNMPPWVPAENNGSPVIRRIQIPIAF